MKKIYKITGLDCASCASLVEMDLEDAGVLVKCSYANQTLEINSDHDFKKIKEIITKAGYTLIHDK